MQPKERARNNLIYIFPLPGPLPEGEGVRCSSYFVHVPKQWVNLNAGRISTAEAYRTQINENLL